MPTAGATIPFKMPVISPPKSVSISHAPKPTSALVAARRTSTDRSRPNASQRAMYKKVTISQKPIRRTSSAPGAIPSRMIPNAAITPTVTVSTSPMTTSPAANLPLITSSR